MTLSDILQVEYVKLVPDEGITRTKVCDVMLQPNGILHGGISALDGGELRQQGGHDRAIRPTRHIRWV